MARHSMAFANFSAGYDDATLNTESMQRMFGSAVCRTASSPCELTLGATAFMNKANKAMLGGRCEGFAVLASMMESGKVNAADFGGEAARDLTLADNTPLQRELAYWFATQLHPTVTEKTKGYMAKDVMPILVEALATNAPERFRIGIVKKVGDRVTGGHAVTPIAYYRESEGVYVLRVYDNNFPDSAREMRIDTKANRWEYEASANPARKPSLYFGDDTNKNPLYLAPIFSRSGELPCHFCSGSGKTQVTTSGGLQALVNGIGISGGEVKTSGSGQVSPTFSSTNDDDGASWTIVVDKTDMFQVSMTSGDDGNSTDATEGAIDVSGDTFSASLSGLNLVAPDDAWSVSGDGAKQSFSNESHTPVTITQRVTRGGNIIGVSAFVDGPSDTLTTEIKDDGKIQLQATGAVGTVTVEVSVKTEDGMTKSGTLSYTAAGDSTLDTDSKQLEMTGTVAGTVSSNGMTQPLGSACEDGVRSGMESDVDCGGTCAAKCELGLGCNSGADCLSTTCAATDRRCVATTCEDQARSGDETDVDCGGSCAARCAVNSACTTSLDCDRGLACDASVCKTSFVLRAAVTGLRTGGSVTLTNATNGDAVTISTNDTIPFPARIVGMYNVSITAQPATERCAVMNAVGTAAADVTVTVACTPLHAIGGTVAGLEAGATLVLRNNGGDDVTVSSDGPFVFPTRVNGAYVVTVDTQPVAQLCTVANGTGTATSDVTAVTVTCASTFSVGGTVTGLDAGKSVVLRNNGGADLTVSTNGAFTFPARVSGGYAVTVQTQPMLQLCTVANASGTATADVSNVTVTCGTAGFTIGGNVTGLAAGQSVTLQNNGGDDLTLMASGAFTFTTPATAYAVTILTQPTNGSCAVSNGAGTASAVVTTVQVTCVTSGVLDLTWGTSGFFSEARTGVQEWFRGVVQPDNSTVWVGVERIGAVTNTDIAVSKLTAGGAFDTGFASTGTLVLSRGVATERARAIHRNADGTFLVAAEAAGPVAKDFTVLRITAAGALDTTFGTAGVVQHDSAASGDDYLTDMVVRPDGTIILVGTNGLGTAADIVMMGLTPAGALDPAFGTGGRVVFGAPAVEDLANAVTLTAAGQIVVVGSSGPDSLVLRYTSAGARDMTFGTMGAVVADLSGATQLDGLNTVTMDGTTVMVAGYASDGTSNDMLVASYGSTGTPTAGFGTAGVLRINRGGNDVVRRIIRSAAGGYYIAGTSDTRMSIGKLQNTGMLTMNFGVMGFYENQFALGFAVANELLIDSAGNLLPGGVITDATVNADFGAARLSP
ncbi:MAG: hypothetical protein Q8N26_21390 [Myxococcales bacterium]|nr:hypothetical protein [Myxococcales bacterium]